MSEDIEKAFKGQAPGYSKHVGYTRYVNGKAIRVEGGAQPHQKVTLAAPGSVKHKGGEFLDRLHSYVHKKAPTTEHELQEAVHRFVHGKFEGDEKALNKFHAEGMKELSRHGLVTHHEPKAAKAGPKSVAEAIPKKEKKLSREQSLKKEIEEHTATAAKHPEGSYEHHSAKQKLYNVMSVMHNDAGDAEKAKKHSKLSNKHARLAVDAYQRDTKKETQADRNAKWVKDNEDKTGLRPKLAGWQYHEGNKIQAPLSSKGDYVISHRREREGKERHNVSYRPTGKHEHVGEYPSAKEAAAAADAHSKSSKKQVDKDEPPKRLDREIAERKTEKPKAAEPEKVLPKIPSFEEATHKRLSALAEHPKAKKKAIAALAERIASKPGDATHADLHAEISALEQRHGIDPTEQPEKIGYHEPAVQRAMKKFPSGKALLDATGQDSPAHVKANAYEAARRMSEGQKETPSLAKPAPKAEEKKPVASAPQAAQGKGKFIESSVQYLVDNMSESELRSRLPQASDEIKANVNEALRRLAEKKDAKS